MASAYLLIAQLNPHRIAILRWNRSLAARAEVRAACTPEHALEMVAHWMVSGRLDLTFTGAGLRREHSSPQNRATKSAVNLAETCRPIGELVINQESVRNLVANDPEALASVLDSLLEALQRDKGTLPSKKAVLHTTLAWHSSIA
jgi:hypothetical protein